MKRAAIAGAILSIVIISISTGSQAELSTKHLDSDAEMLEYLSDTLYVAEGRIGDRGGAATFELDLGFDTGAPYATAQYDWESGKVEPFELIYNSTTGEVEYSLGGITLHYTTPYFDFDQIFIRTRAVNEGTTVTVSDILLDCESVNDQSSASSGDGLDILWILGAELNDGFTLSGNAVLEWAGDPPTQSRLAFQIKVGKLGLIGVEDSSWGSIKAAR